MAVRNLSLYLNDYYVGMLTMLLDGRSVLSFDKTYLEDLERPTLSLAFKNALSQVQARDIVSHSGKLSPFFSNLLPEGKLRTYLARKAGVRETQEFPLLVALSDDLPGAVFLHADEDSSAPSSEAPVEGESPEQKVEGQLRFSLAGVQLKFSGDLIDSKIVIPAHGVGGHWIVKLPSPGYSHLNELEYSMLRLASEIGIEVPEFRLVPISHLQNLPKDLPETLEGDCLLSRRFDRSNDGTRIHMEDMAQVFAIYDKYDERYNYQSVANVLWQETGLGNVLEFVRRLVHTFAIGNADMHMKNWALIYPDTRNPRLSPAYDLVSTIVYPNIQRQLSHKMAGIKDFEKIGIDAFKDFSTIAKLPERPVIKAATETVDSIKEAWPRLKDDLPMPESFKRLIEEHMSRIPLFTERPTTTLFTASMDKPSRTHVGSFVEAIVELDEAVPIGEIVYRKQDGSEITMQAPRRMVSTLVNNQLGKLISEHPGFANQRLTALVGRQLYNEWRSETFIRIKDRLVDGGIDPELLNQAEIKLIATFMPLNWRKLEDCYKSKENTSVMDFEFADGELWTSDCVLTEIELIEVFPDGRRKTKVQFKPSNVRKLTNLSS